MKESLSSRVTALGGCASGTAPSTSNRRQCARAPDFAQVATEPAHQARLGAPGVVQRRVRERDVGDRRVGQPVLVLVFAQRRPVEQPVAVDVELALPAASDHHVRRDPARLAVDRASGRPRCAPAAGRSRLRARAARAAAARSRRRSRPGPRRPRRSRRSARWPASRAAAARARSAPTRATSRPRPSRARSSPASDRQRAGGGDRPAISAPSRSTLPPTAVGIRYAPIRAIA